MAPGGGMSMGDFAIMVIGIRLAALLVALAVDRWWGEPAVAWHPVVWMGRYLGATGQRISPAVDSPTRRRRLRPFLLGASAWMVGAMAFAGLAVGCVALISGLAWWIEVLLLGLALKPLLAWRMLHDEVAQVEQALMRSLEAGRTRLALLVSRDVRLLDAGEVRESAIESLAENLNDSVVAPLFWFVLLGLPGAALYRFANTADAMWGYRGERSGRDWTWAGKWAARADDALSWLPARLSALSIRWVSPSRVDAASLRREARRTPSPNSGWPMAAMALACGLRLGKRGAYLLNEKGRHPDGNDVAHALKLAGRVVRRWAWSAALGLLAVASIRLATHA